MKRASVTSTLNSIRELFKSGFCFGSKRSHRSFGLGDASIYIEGDAVPQFAALLKQLRAEMRAPKGVPDKTIEEFLICRLKQKIQHGKPFEETDIPEFEQFIDSLQARKYLVIRDLYGASLGRDQCLRLGPFIIFDRMKHSSQLGLQEYHVKSLENPQFRRETSLAICCEVVGMKRKAHLRMPISSSTVSNFYSGLSWAQQTGSK